MSAGHIVNGQCVDVAESKHMFFSQILPTLTAGQTSYYTRMNLNSAGDWYLATTATTNNVDTLVSYTYRAPPIFPSCDTTTTFYDGMTIGWGVAAAMVVAWAIHVLRRAT